MRKFKLIKSYPNSPELGAEYKDDKEGFGDGTPHFYCNSTWVHPTDHPEFWEEIVPKDYEILSFKRNNAKYTDLWLSCGPDRWAGYLNNKVVTSYYSTEDILNSPFHYIYEVKRLSDGKIFTVGDWVDTPRDGDYSRFQIDKFELKKNSVVAISQHINIVRYIKDLNHVRQVLLTTEDGVDVREGDKYYSVDMQFDMGEIIASVNIDLEYPNKRFSSEKHAKDYISFNMPLLSYNDIKECITSRGSMRTRDYLQGAIRDIISKKMQDLFH